MLALPLILLLQAAASQVTTELPPENLTVTAPVLDAAAVNKMTRAYVNSVLPTPQSGQFFRWNKPVCIKHSGLNAQYEARVTDRIAAIAAKAGVAMDKPGCAPNVLVVFTDDAGAVVDAISRKQPESLRHLSTAERATLRDSKLPVRWWYATGTAQVRARAKSQDPDKPADSRSLVARTSNSDSDSYTQPSLISKNQTVFVSGAVVIVDVGLAEGTPLDTLADYVAMVTLVPARVPPKAPGVPSILALFDPPVSGTRPTELSSWDWQLLTSFYAARADRDAKVQKRQIVNSISDAKAPSE